MAWFEAKTGPAAYKLPPAAEDEDDRLGALKEFRQQGESFVRQQRAYMDFDKALDLIAGVADRRPTSLSNIKNNQLKRDVREAVASLSNLKPTWTYVSGDRKADNRVHALNKRQQHWYFQTFADQRVRDVYQYAAVFGTGYIVPAWKRKHWGYGSGDIELKVLSPRDVLPVQLPPDGNLQDAYIVTLRFETPVNMARAAWPTDIDKLIPDRDSPTGLMRASNQMLQFLSPALNVGNALRGRENQNHAWPTVDLYWSYVMDMSINMTGRDVLMGEPGTSWSYTVPWLGKQIPDGTYSINGPNLRAADAEDCLLYPHRRLVVWTNQGILRDGPSYDIHGMVPAVPFYFDKWAWENLGFSLVRDTANIHQSATRLLRAIDDSQNAKLRPLIIYNENLISSNLAKRIDPRVPGIQIPPNTRLRSHQVPVFVCQADPGSERAHRARQSQAGAEYGQYRKIRRDGGTAGAGHGAHVRSLDDAGGRYLEGPGHPVLFDPRPHAEIRRHRRRRGRHRLRTGDHDPLASAGRESEFPERLFATGAHQVCHRRHLDGHCAVKRPPDHQREPPHEPAVAAKGRSAARFLDDCQGLRDRQLRTRTGRHEKRI